MCVWHEKSSWGEQNKYDPIDAKNVQKCFRRSASCLSNLECILDVVDTTRMSNLCNNLVLIHVVIAKNFLHFLQIINNLSL